MITSVRLVVVLVCLSACGRLGFTAAGANGDGGSGGDGARDGIGPDVAFGNCWSAWLPGPPSLSTPQQVAELATAMNEGDPSLSDDALQIYFTRVFPSSSGDIMVATRADRSSPFSTPTAMADLNTTMDETKLTLSNAGLLAVWSSNRTGSMGYDLWEAARSSTTAAFGAASLMPFTQVNDGQNQYDPHLSSDGLRLYLAPAQASTQIVQLATRSSQVANFGTPADVVDLGTNFNADPTLSPEELVIVYSARQSLGNPLNLWYATRASSTGPFTNPQPLGIDPAQYAQDPMVSYDGCELFFAIHAGGTATGTSDIYRAVVQ